MEIIETADTKYRDAIINLYIEAFSIGQSEQYIDNNKLSEYIDVILNNGYALLAVENKLIVGAVLLCPLRFDNAIPEQISANYDIEKCIYVAEMMVAQKVRGQGIGLQLMTNFLITVDKSHYSDAFIRVWNENMPAISLYKKIGFEPVATIEQLKTKADKSGTFVMQKIYLHKKLN